MPTDFDKQIWLAWLVKVRILILTVLLGVELAIAQFSPVAFPVRLFVDAILLAYTISVFHLLLLHFWNDPKLQASLQVGTDLLLNEEVTVRAVGVACCPSLLARRRCHRAPGALLFAESGQSETRKWPWDPKM